MFILLLFFVLGCLISGYGNTDWYCADELILDALLGKKAAQQVAREASIGYKETEAYALESLDDVKSVKQAEEALRPVAEKQFNVLTEFHKGWCKDFKTLLNWADSLYDDMDEVECCLARISVYMFLGKSCVFDQHNKKELFSLKEMPKKCLSIKNTVKAFVERGKCYKFLIKDDGNLAFTFLEGLMSIVQENPLVVLTTDMSQSGKIEYHGRVKSSLLSQLGHDAAHAGTMSSDRLMLNNCQEKLYTRFVKRIMDVVREYWTEKGLEYVVAAFSLLHEKNINALMKKKAMVLQKRCCLLSEIIKKFLIVVFILF